jgi:para-nitrobenzyl esterase
MAMRKLLHNLVRLAVLGLFTSNVSIAADGPVVKTASGAVQGVMDDLVAVFRGLPYAAPPAGALRWRPPQSVPAWQGVRDASADGHACPQPAGKYREWADSAIQAAGIDEDCLTLNIFASADALASEARVPVMFYIHGGNMQFGANVMPLYDGTDLVQKGVVLVVINYRLGYLGRFGHPALTREQPDEPLVNYGLFDQIAALQWVHENIAAFGGDPNNVTIFGHSAGGVSVNALMTTPQSKGLFHKAIAQGSGILLDRNQHAFESLPRGLIGLSSEQVGELFAEYFAIVPGADAEVAAALRAVPWQDIIEYQNSKQMPFNPVVDGTVLTDHVAQVFERGEQHNVPYIGGANSWEWNQIADIPLIGKWFLGGALIDGLADEDLAAFDDQWTRIGLSQRWFAEGLFLASTRYLGKQMATVSAPAWLYHVTYVQTAIRGEVPGAAHGAEMPYLFGQIAEHPEYQRPELAAAFPPSEEDLRWGNTVQAYWLNMAKTGNPNGDDLPGWPEYRPDSDIILDLGVEIVPTPYLYKETLDQLEERALIRRAQFDQLEAGG